MQATEHIVLNPLPFDVTLEKIYSDFMRYLLEQTRVFFQQRIVDGANTWKQHEATMQFVVAHPNGWGFIEQSFLRRAAISAGLVPSDLSSRDRIQFVTEGEASVHFVLVNSDLQNRIQVRASIFQPAIQINHLCLSPVSSWLFAMPVDRLLTQHCTPSSK